MRKNLKGSAMLYPQPVTIIGTYDENYHANAMNAAWAGVYDYDQIILCLTADHKTTKNILNRKQFTVSIGTRSQVIACDYVGITSGNKVLDKIEKTGWTVEKAEKVDAPIFTQLPLALECEFVSMDQDNRIVGKVVNVNADESILTPEGKIDVDKLQAITYDPSGFGYYVLGEKVGQAFSDGKKIK